MKRIALTATIALLATAVAAMPRPSELNAALPTGSLIGEGTARFLGKTVFDISLWADSGKPFSQAEPFALAITYKTGISASFLASLSAREIARIEGSSKSKYADLEMKLEKCFRDVSSGDRITGVSTGATTAKFYMNGRKTCSVSHPSLRNRFFGIWLSPGTRDLALRDKLMGN